LAKETWKIIKNLSIADQLKEKEHCNNCYDNFITIIIVFIARIDIQGLQMQWLKRIFEIEPVCSAKMEYSSSNTLKNIVV